MANTIDFILTTAAEELISKVIAGKTLNFTRMAVGDGFSYDTNVAKGFKNVVNEVLSLDITKKETLSPSSVRITSAFKNTDAQKEFYYREVGLYAQDPDTGEEVLYAYGNRNDAAELITPAGSNIVTKQLIFIISVGDSANVTFNVNADVYALQSDMLDVQANIENLQSNKADKNLANTGMITNCLLEIPQRIKYELTPEGALTIKAGTVVIVPYGTEDLRATYPIGSTFLHQNFITVDTQYADNKFFIWIEIQEDIVLYTYGEVTENAMVFIKPVDNQVTNWGEQGIKSGITPGEGELFFYNTETNFISVYSNGISYDSRFSLPILHISKNTGVITSINQVFNGMGYIGSHAWIDKGVKGLIPNGRNPDGSLNNIEYIVPNIAFKDCSNSNYTNIIFFVNIEGDLGHNFFFESETIISKGDVKTYIPSRNKIYSNNSIVQKELYVARGTIENKKIVSFRPYTTFRPVDKSNDKQWLASLSLPSNKYKNIELKATGSNYTAPTNGWYAIRKVVGIATAGVSCAVYDATGTTEIYRQTSKNPVAEDEVAMIIPILKGQVLQVSYDATGKTEYFRFIYAQGETD